MSQVDCGRCPNVTSGCSAGHCLKAIQYPVPEPQPEQLNLLEDNNAD